MALALYALLFAASALMFLVWRIPFQWGLAYVVLDEFLRLAMMYAALTFLTIIIHPLIAVLMLMVINESTFYWLILWLSAGIRNTAGGLAKAALTAGKYLLYALYMLLPSSRPFPEQAAKITASLKISFSDLRYFAATLAYSLLVSALFYFLSVFALKHKRLT